MEIRKLVPTDVERLTAFLREIPEDDRTFFKQDLSDPETIAAAVRETHGLWLVALERPGGSGEPRIIGYVRVLPGTGLSSHVAEIRLVVAPAHRRHGLGRALAHRALVDSVRELRLRKLFVEVAAEQEALIRMFRKLGFTAEAILRDHLRDRRGTMRDLLLLCHFVEENWSALAGLGIDREVS
ncbi:MAG: GNAT family N-acetyltransferase [Deltaproteobacteria bacterium]|nr:GNAT family N-acetyltransferase [Deltaproteobacteria bacterium]